MVVVRYAALASLVVWLGALQAATISPGATDRIWLHYLCGAVILVSLLTMKFLGPPPPGFAARLGVVAIMLLLTVYEHRFGRSPFAAPLSTTLGFALLIWYVRE